MLNIEEIEQRAETRQQSCLGILHLDDDISAFYYRCHGDIAALLSEAKSLRAENARLREALLPFAEWLNHLNVTGSRRLNDNEWPEISGAPKMAAIRRAASVLGERG